jgi:hypothetical protein
MKAAELSSSLGLLIVIIIVIGAVAHTCYLIYVKAMHMPVMDRHKPNMPGYALYRRIYSTNFLVFSVISSSLLLLWLLKELS